MGNITVTSASGYGSPEDGQTLKVEKPEGITTDFNYDLLGHLTSMIQNKGDGTTLNTSYYYNQRYNICRAKIPERGDILYNYNNNNEMVGYAEGLTSGANCADLPAYALVALSYDSLGRLQRTDYPGTTPDITRSYDANGNLLTIDRGGVHWTYSYNNIDLLTSESLNIDGRNYYTNYGYDNNGALTSTVYPSGRGYTYANDNFSRPISVNHGATNYINSIHYHPNGKINSLNRGNGGSYEQRLNERQLTSYIGGSNSPISQYYSYNANRQITQIDSTTYDVYDRSFNYDGVGRLISASGPWGSGSYSYDSLGNLKQKILGSRTVNIEYTSQNQIYRMQDSATGGNWRYYGPDARGNIINDGLHSFTYDYANQPTAISGAHNGTYIYDGNLKRVKQVVDGKTIYSVYDKSGTLLTRDDISSNTKTDYISLAGQTLVRVKNGVANYPLNDHLGTALFEEDQNRNISNSKTYNYTPFGENLATALPFGTAGNDPAINNEQGFTGHIEDNTGLVYMQARYYDPVIGRFLQPDPVGYADQINLYAYVGNDPVNNVDPDGKFLHILAGAIAGAVGSTMYQGLVNGHVNWGEVLFTAGAGALVAATDGVSAMITTVPEAVVMGTANGIMVGSAGIIGNDLGVDGQLGGEGGLYSWQDDASANGSQTQSTNESTSSSQTQSTEELTRVESDSATKEASELVPVQEEKLR